MLARVQRLELMLGEVRDVHVQAERARARVGLEHAREHLEQGRLAGAVRPDERDLVAAVQREVEPVVDHEVPVGLRARPRA